MKQVTATVGLLTVIISVLLTAFAWPAVRSSVHDVPIAVAGPAPAVAQVTAALEQRLPGAFDVTAVTDTAAAERLIKDREAYGAIDLTSGTPQVITASAASTAVAQTLQALGTALAHEGQAPTTAVRDLAALPTDDPRGAGLAAGALPLVIGGILAAVLLTARVRGTGRRVAGALAFAVTGGLAMAAILQFWLGSLGGDYLANAGAIGLAVAATALTVLGLESLLGMAGVGIGAATMMLVGNPLSGAATAPQMLPGWSGALGQLLPPGAGGSLLRSTAFFDGAAATRPVIVLLAWLAVGALLCLAGAMRARRRPATAPAEPAREVATAAA
ncbi:hypothetical protein FHR83_006866 [Actinoplanes campanulatus]|uniref:ABC transporter permease n=1 Tax=Actinoplanes campanulatus TaxID=113559 RepID=A0A7W5FI68_9ACTN|nr:ABC transporter permease [Actinoplanes campanulatus]MBB3099160.1 hypothetical protein [Actinoplanes campanulatus]GGN38747.1 hypothetical protein GCM10010109_65930 [Actinoplanes campanulatus]GID40316.1 hypothetical protein Aca09nite_68220 [Actinoplanes campanulatus]